MDDEELQHHIRHDEDSVVALKRVDVGGRRIKSPDGSDFADELAAMANNRGVTVVLGVDYRSREILGVNWMTSMSWRAGFATSAMIR